MRDLDVRPFPSPFDKFVWLNCFFFFGPVLFLTSGRLTQLVTPTGQNGAWRKRTIHRHKGRVTLFHLLKLVCFNPPITALLLVPRSTLCLSDGRRGVIG